MLDKIKNEIVKKETDKSLNTATPTIKKEETAEDKSDNRISITLSYKDCVAQGNTIDECETLTKDKPSGLDSYNFKDPKMPSLMESAENIFIKLNLRH